MKYDNKYLKQLAEKIMSAPHADGNDFIFKKISYKKLYDIAASIQDIFDKHGAGLNDHVILFTENRALIAASVIASLYGGPILVLPYALSHQALNEISNVMGINKVITDKDVDLPVGMEIIRPGISKSNRNFGEVCRNKDTVFLKLFTGGSTGKPRVWSKTTGNILFEADFLQRKFAIEASDLFSVTVPPYHIYGFLFSIILPLLSSASVHEESFTFPREIVSSLEDYESTVFVSIPVHYRVLKRIDINKKSMRLAFSSAGALNAEDGEVFYNKTGVGINEIYGSTETGGIASRNRNSGQESLELFDDVVCKVSEDIICVKSPFISPDLTLDSDGFYQGSDRIKLLDSRHFALLGRIDGIVKVGGKRVDIEDVREKIIKLPGVNDAYVFYHTREDARENEICALVQCDMEKIRLIEALQGVVEPHAVPKKIAIVDKMPLSSTGKYDRKMILEIMEIL